MRATPPSSTDRTDPAGSEFLVNSKEVLSSNCAPDDGNNPIERVALVLEALAFFHARRNDLSDIGASEMRSLEPHHPADCGS
jgi:hypothetical protein